MIVLSEWVLPREQALGRLQFDNGLTSTEGRDLATCPISGQEVLPGCLLRGALVTLQRQHTGHVSGALAAPVGSVR